jgi:hypothetical protein
MAEGPQGHISSENQWTTYEANVQSYRSLSMSAQSVYLAVGAILLGAEIKIPFYAVLGFAMVTTWYIFFPLIFARTAIVDFYKFDLGSLFDADGHLRALSGKESRLSERAYANVLKGRHLRKKVYAALEIPGPKPFRTLRETRVKLDVIVPITMTLVWLIFAGSIV